MEQDSDINVKVPLLSCAVVSSMWQACVLLFRTSLLTKSIYCPPLRYVNDSREDVAVVLDLSSPRTRPSQTCSDWLSRGALFMRSDACTDRGHVLASSHVVNIALPRRRRPHLPCPAHVNTTDTDRAL